jgi:DNA polymerase-4
VDNLTKIIHLDMDAFYAAVEQRDNPQFRNRPLVVGGSPRGRGVVCTASYEARKFGISSAMSCAKAYKLCPDLIFVRPNLEKYRAVSKQIHKIFREVTDIIEPISLDEAYLDVTHNKFNEPSATVLANYLRARIKASVGITASAGVSSVKFVAKIASDMNKPDGITVIAPDDIFSFLTNLPVKKLWGVGKSTEAKLHELGIYTVDDIRKKPKAFFITHLGSQGQFLYDLAFGRDERPVGIQSRSHSIASESTFRDDIVDWEDKVVKVRDFAASVAGSIIKKQQQIKTITVKVRFSDFSTKTKSRTLNCFTDDPEKIVATAEQLLAEIENIKEEPIRLLGVTIRNFAGEQTGSRQQLELPLAFER